MVEASDQSPAARQSFGKAYCMQSRSLQRRKQGSLREWENSQSLGRPFVTRARKAALDFVRVEPPDYAFGVGDLSEPLLPSVPALAEVLSERFAYQSAVESHDAEATRSQGEGDRLDSAGSFTEKTLQEGPCRRPWRWKRRSQKACACWRRTSTSRTRTRTRPSCEIGPQVEVPPPPPGLGSRQGLDVLDPNVVRSALAAGISEKHLQEMAGLLRKHLSAWKASLAPGLGTTQDMPWTNQQKRTIAWGWMRRIWNLSLRQQRTQWRRPSSS